MEDNDIHVDSTEKKLNFKATQKSNKLTYRQKGNTSNENVKQYPDGVKQKKQKIFKNNKLQSVNKMQNRQSDTREQTSNIYKGKSSKYREKDRVNATTHTNKFQNKINIDGKNLSRTNKTTSMLLNAFDKCPEQEEGNSQRKNNRSANRFHKKGNPNALKIIFLGGVGEIGKNMTAFEYGNEILIIDAGLTFPDEELPGIDLVIPDITYLVKNRQKIKGVVLTHGHEDHIGGLPYLLKEVKAQVYGTKLTLALAENKLREHKISSKCLKCVPTGGSVQLGCFGVEFINVTHSIAGAVALCIDTPVGKIVHTGDFKIDLTPVAGDKIDMLRLAELGNKGIKLLMCESTNVERAGYTMSESVVGNTLDSLFTENATRRLIVATFASNVHRLQQIIDIAHRHKRKVALSGRSMLNVVEAASKIGAIVVPDNVLIDVEKIKNYFDHEIVIVSTGSQGEPMSALSRMANGEFNKVVIGDNDTIIISASPIPGNEKMVSKVINNLYRRGAKVVYESLEKIHVSGHACQEELKVMHSLVKPEYFIPIHGEIRHLMRHAQLAMSLGMPESKILIADIGNCIELSKHNMQFGESVAAGARLVDGGHLEGRENSVVIKDRKHLSADGIFVITVAVSQKTGNLISQPTVVARGFVMPEKEDYIEQVISIVEQTAVQTDILADINNTDFTGNIQKAVKNFIYRKTKQNPVIMANIVRI